MKTAELIGPALDWAVARAAGYLTGGHFHYVASKLGDVVEVPNELK